MAFGVLGRAYNMALVAGRSKMAAVVVIHVGNRLRVVVSRCLSEWSQKPYLVIEKLARTEKGTPVRVVMELPLGMEASGRRVAGPRSESPTMECFALLHLGSSLRLSEYFMLTLLGFAKTGSSSIYGGNNYLN